jgi:UDP-N-acetylglucosamine--N-acetylmuramyl-(pentapeptide) pyrophosphoryl-undecaprenol N-acetylglucosamine transferase
MTPGRVPFVLLAAGGTGGHVFPAEALAAVLTARGCRLGLMTDARGQRHGGALGHLETWRVQAGGIAGTGLLGKLSGAVRLVWGMLQARRLMARLKPDVVVGFGGYAAFPGCAAAIGAQRPTVIHEQNAVLGRANRLLASGATRIATALPVTRHVPSGKGHHVGNPVRPATLQGRDLSYAPPAPGAPIRLLVTGGSQGARILSDLVPLALAGLPDDLRGRVQVAQQCRPEDLARVQEAYQAAGIEAETAPFFDDIPARLAAAHLVICRAGASTVAELTCVGRPAVLIPYPTATDDHQTANARALDEAGAGWLTPQDSLDSATLSHRLADLLSAPKTLADAAARARALGRPDAAERLADLVLSLTTHPQTVETAS